MSFTIHPQAASGFYAAVSYDTHRPNYSPLSVDSLLLELGVRGVKDARIVELGAGTGKFTELLASRPEQYEIVAGEPHDQMRGVLENKNLARTTVVADLAENLANVEDGWADAVIVAQVSVAWVLQRPHTNGSGISLVCSVAGLYVEFENFMLSKATIGSQLSTRFARFVGFYDQWQLVWDSSGTWTIVSVSGFNDSSFCVRTEQSSFQSMRPLNTHRQRHTKHD